MARILVGTSGFIYKHWSDGVFYPPHLPQSQWFGHYRRFFDTVEINFSFYRLPAAAAYRSWRARTAPDFIFAIKGSRFISHIKRLKDCREPLRVYFSRAVHLREKLGVVLWQLPPFFKKDIPRLEEFMDELRPYRYRHCFEFRHASWFDDDTFRTLSARNYSLCHAHPSVAKDFPMTADYVYIRRHGRKGGGYSNAFLKKDAEAIRKWTKQGKDVYIYFNNDAEGNAIRNAFTLKRLLNLPIELESPGDPRWEPASAKIAA
jgi:uncharacterized protein YecE (DUF72 family)